MSSGSSAIGVVPTSGGVGVRLARVGDDEAVGEGDEPGRDLDASDPVAEQIEIVSHRKRRVQTIRSAVSRSGVARGMDVELKQHRRRGRTFKGDVESGFDQHGAILVLVDRGGRPNLARGANLRGSERHARDSETGIGGALVPAGAGR